MLNLDFARTLARPQLDFLTFRKWRSENLQIEEANLFGLLNIVDFTIDTEVHNPHLLDPKNHLRNCHL